MARRRPASRSAGDLPQKQETWYAVVQQLRVWITPPDEEAYRPYVIVVLNRDLDMIQVMDLAPAEPNAEQLLEMMMKAIQSPQRETRQRPHRPERIQFEQAEIVAAIRPELEKIGVQVEHATRRPAMIKDMLEDLESHMRGGHPEPPGLLSLKGVTPEAAGGMFAAAAEFYRAAPWVYLSDQQTLAVQVEPEPEPRFVQVMGGGGVEYGLAMYRRWEDVERIFGFADNPMELLPPEGGHSFLYQEEHEMPIADLEAIEQYGWPVAKGGAYPMPVIFTPAGEVKRPSRADLFWYEAVLRAIPIFVEEHLPEEMPEADAPLEVEFSVPVHTGETRVWIKYPGGSLPTMGRPVDMMDWDELDEDETEFASFDRRAMEGVMGMLGGGLDNPALQEAQNLMYQAWEERNPARRIILAHEALEVSADCADAYVLLAEEEADTVGKALEYYQEGVAAGERALGQEYFEENTGHFWGLIETRPYMRARQGLANTLWELGRKEEAVGHYRDMLRLNPGDNQGNRYSLLNLLLDLKRDDDAQILLKEYDDGMAEWLYTGALLAFRKGGASKEADRALREALEMNPHVPAYLAGQKRIPVRLPDYIGFGDENEAISYAAGYLGHWRRTPGAIEWLEGHVKPVKKTGPRTKGGGKGRRKPRK